MDISQRDTDFQQHRHLKSVEAANCSVAGNRAGGALAMGGGQKK